MLYKKYNKLNNYKLINYEITIIMKTNINTCHREFHICVIDNDS